MPAATTAASARLADRPVSLAYQESARSAGRIATVTLGRIVLVDIVLVDPYERQHQRSANESFHGVGDGVHK